MAAAFSLLLPSKQSFYIMENTNKMSGNLFILLLAIVKADAYSTVDKNLLFQNSTFRRPVSSLLLSLYKEPCQYQHDVARRRNEIRAKCNRLNFMFDLTAFFRSY